MTKGFRHRSLTKRDQILGAAERLFLENGFALTSMDAITAEAGVSKQTVYSYFPSKEDLFETVLRDLVIRNARIMAMEQISQSIEMDTIADLERCLKELAELMVSGLMQPTYIELVRMTIAESRRLPHLGLLFRQAVPERMMTIIASILNLAQKAGIAHVPDIEIAARLFVGPLLTYVIIDGLLIEDSAPSPPPPERLSALVDHFLKSIVPA